MTRELTIHAVHQGEMRIAADNGRHTLQMDYPLQPGELTGLTPLEVLLASLAGCSGNTLALLLGRMAQPVSRIEVNAHGVRREEHPTVLTSISLEFVLHGTGIDESAVTRAISQAEERVCPVWAMLKGGTPITASYRIVAA